MRDSRRNHIIKILSYTLTATLLGIWVVYLFQNAARIDELLELSIGSIIWLIILALLFTFMNGVINYLLYTEMGVPLWLNEAIGLAAVNTLANQLPFAGGLIVKGAYLKQRYRLAYTHFVSATLALYVCFVAANGVVGLLILIHMSSYQIIPYYLFLAFGAMVVSVVLLWIPRFNLRLLNNSSDLITRLWHGWHIFRRNKYLLGKLVIIQIIMTFFFAVRLWVAFKLLEGEVTLLQCLLFASASVLTQLISITPGGLGIREAIVVILASVLGFETTVSITAVSIDRLVSTIVIISVGIIYTYVLSKKAQGYVV